MGKKLHTLFCDHCTNEFTSTTKTQKYCSRSCSASATQIGKPSKNRQLADKEAPPPTCRQCGSLVSSYRRSICHTCAESNRESIKHRPQTNRDRKQVRERVMFNYNKIRNQLVAELGGHCVACGASDTESRLDFDHIDPSTKTIAVTTAITRSVELARSEAITKCQLLCRSCHCKKTFSSDSFKKASRERTGLNNKLAKLTDDQRMFVFEQHKLGQSLRSIARELGVTHQTLGGVLNSPYWKAQYEHIS